MKVGRNLPKHPPRARTAGRLDRADLCRARHHADGLVDAARRRATTPAPYFSLVLVPGSGRGHERARLDVVGTGPGNRADQ
jgi:precorrin-2 methylase